IRDDGMGFTAEALAAMIKNIGGSPKRTPNGAEIGVTDPNDPTRSPKGRKLIGKLGIGLFAVSQLTHEFQVITKRQGDAFRTVADVLLFQYAEKVKGRSTKGEEATGSVKIWKVPARDSKSHGTEVVLRKLLPRTKQELASHDMWSAALAVKPDDNDDGAEQKPQPLFHIGCVETTNPNEFLVPPKLPWEGERDPDRRFALFAESMFNRAHDRDVRRPSLENTFDNYLKFLWYISLSAPLDYLDGHPFDLSGADGLRIFRLSNSKTEGAAEVKLRPRQIVRQAIKLKSPERGANMAFRVLVDGVSLKRPLRFTNLPTSSHAVDQPLLFIGKDRPDLSKHEERVRGGDLEFEGYLMWCPRVVPVEHNGILIRINDASGTLFDSTFMDYQVSELTRVRQVTAEIFVTEGLDAALNIDRESFNSAHPHYQYLKSWVHNAFKQFATRHKDIAKGVRGNRLAREFIETKKGLSRIVENAVDRWTKGAEQPVPVDFASPLEASATTRSKDRLVFDLEKIFADNAIGKATSKNAVEFDNDQTIMRGVAQVLYAAGVFDKMSHDAQQRLLADLAKVIFHRRVK
ncbi:MAG: hypothetical protein K8R36_04135, partial [Planctomycetales bacterium]|nr:hypothetical protein [Planctomycetales bacterium]